MRPVDHNARRAGFTFIEVMVAMLIFTMAVLAAARSLAPTSREACATRTGSPAKRCEKVLKC